MTGVQTCALPICLIGAAALAKTIILTGAMIPFSVQESDALFNLGFALAAAQILPSGTFVTMNGKVFGWDRVTKNRVDGVFETAPESAV